MAMVLVVEDNPVNMRLAVLLLRKAGHSPLCAVDAESALTMARSAAPDLILMDCQLPGMDGRAATALLKQDPATAGIPVVALSAAPLALVRESSRAGTGDAFLAKPLHFPDLCATLDRLLGRSAGSAIAAVPAPIQGAEADRNAETPPVDLTVLESLVGPDPETMLEFFAGFVHSALRTRLELHRACDEGQAHVASRLAHSLRSSALMVGAGRLAALCAEIEIAGSVGTVDAPGALLPAFERELESVVSFLQNRSVSAGLS